ncbi:hypothetical protein ACFP3R_17730 [Saccharothrix lopnurensis]|uniref:Uncharacterized protein n=2 Tax=Saccharothrix lopnurensis TaxID=1670621 RepID=A0ABW1P8M8_9PSEU
MDESNVLTREVVVVVVVAFEGPSVVGESDAGDKIVVPLPQPVVAVKTKKEQSKNRRSI